MTSGFERPVIASGVGGFGAIADAVRTTGKLAGLVAWVPIHDPSFLQHGGGCRFNPAWIPEVLERPVTALCCWRAGYR